jgi:hypothetical protein
MIPLTKICIFLIFSLFLFYMAEQNVMLHKHSHHIAIQNPVNDPVNTDNQITEDTEITVEDALTSTVPSFQQYSIAHKVVMAIKNRSLVTVTTEHWEPPKQA